jgi:hypothetical protein
MIALLSFFLTLLVSPFKSKSRLEAENAALRLPAQVPELTTKEGTNDGNVPRKRESRELHAWSWVTACAGTNGS